MSGDTVAVLRHPGFLAIVGALIGSFLNVVIHRLPRKMSIVHPPSRCPSCGSRVAPWDNVPILSWLVLRGRCRWCRARISPRYPIVEALTAGLFALGGVLIADPTTLLFMLAFVAAMIAVTFIDLDHMIIPDAITLPGIAVGLGAGLLGGNVGLGQALGGMLLGGGGLLAVATAYRAATGREGLGGGDVKLLGMVGAFLGPVGAFLTIMIGSVAGSIFAWLFLLRRGKSRTAELPFGTFLAPGAVLVLFFGARIVELYWGFFS